MEADPSVRRSVAVLVCGAACLATAAAPAAAHRGKDVGFQTDQPSMLRVLAPGGDAQPIITVGERLDDGYVFESIPDGISLRKAKHGRVEALVNHETSTVPFPLVTVTGEPTQTDPARTLADKTNAMVSRLELASHPRRGVGVTDASLAIPSSANYHRFCSNFLATRRHGFERPLFFTNEEATDFVFRTGQSWRGPGVTAGTEQAGLVVALDPATGEYRSIYGMGRHNHENSVAVPGYGHPVVLSGDDTFSAPASQLYMYTASDADGVWNDRGTLWAFRSNVPTVNDYGDLSAPGSSVSGEFIQVPRDIAVGDQTGLENWSNANNAFQFIRVEDIAYDRRHSNIVYFADTGEPRAVPDAATGRLRRAAAGTTGPYPNGRIFRMVLDPRDPTKVLSLDVIYNGDAGGYNNPAVIHQPDNVETTRDGLLITEDPGSHQQAFPGATNARLWRLDLRTRAAVPVAEVDQSQDPAALPGTWESSGIVDASRWLGKDTFLIDVQAHSLLFDRQQENVYGDSRLDVTTKREGGQLLALRLPGA
jgi:hypothetical protein